MARRLLWLAVAAVLLPAGLFAQAERKDLQVFLDISREVNGYPRFTVFDDVAASVTGGEVTLTGRVTMPFKAKDIASRVAKVPGVVSVRNDIRVLPTSLFDDDLRYRISRSIYASPAFWHYASMSNPPIHILVENGHVTLTGVVHDDVERALARSLASSWGALSVASQLKTDAEVRASLEKLE